MLFVAMWIQCVGQMYTVCVPFEDQSNGTQCMCKGPIQWEYAACTKDQCDEDTMYVTKNLMDVQRTNPMGQCI